MSERIFNNMDEVIKLGEEGIIFGRGHVGDLNRKAVGLLEAKDLFKLNIEVTTADEGIADELLESEDLPLAQKSVGEILNYCKDNPASIAIITGIIGDELRHYDIGNPLDLALDLYERKQYTESLSFIQEAQLKIRLINFQKKFIVQYLEGIAAILEEQQVTLTNEEFAEIGKKVTQVNKQLQRIDSEAQLEAQAILLRKKLGR
jgi:hypothetical protein